MSLVYDVAGSWGAFSRPVVSVGVVVRACCNLARSSPDESACAVDLVATGLRGCDRGLVVWLEAASWSSSRNGSSSENAMLFGISVAYMVRAGAVHEGNGKRMEPPEDQCSSREGECTVAMQM